MAMAPYYEEGLTLGLTSPNSVIVNGQQDAYGIH